MDLSEGKQVRIFLSLFLIIAAGLLFWQGAAGEQTGELYDGRGRVNVNLADAQTLADTPYLDDQLAAAIVRTRTERGLFTSDEELMQVPGIDEYNLPVLQEVLFY